MRILHTSDWHIGRRLKEHDRFEEFIKFFSWLEDVITSENIDVLLVSGDIFDNTTPSITAQNIYYSFLSHIAKSSCRHTVIISGNHDSPAFIDAPAELLKLSRIHVIGQACPNPEDEVITLYDSSGQAELVVCAVPYLRDRDVRTARIDEDFADIDRALKTGIREHYARAFDRARELQQEHYVPIVAMGHMFVQGGAVRQDEGERPLYVGTAVKMEADMFPDFVTYTALGHLHSPQHIGRENVRYSGSPIAMTFGEAGQSKSLYVVEIDGDTLKGIKDISVPCYQKLTRIEGTEKELEGQIDILGREDKSVWIEAIYTGNEIITDLRNRLNEYASQYPGLEILSFEDAGHIPVTGTGSFNGKTLEEFSPEKIFEQLLDDKEVSEEKRVIYREMYKEILNGIEAEKVQ